MSERKDYDTIIVVGGGCYGSYYVTQLRRARAAGAITYNRVVAVDRDPACRVAQVKGQDNIELVIDEWTAFFDYYFANVAPDAKDAIVPSPMMPHLMYEWLLRQAIARYPDRTIETVALPAEPNVPWRRTAPDNTEYVSYATWMCPINCIEPRRCPHTRGERTWTMPNAAAELVKNTADSAQPLFGPAIFHCVHRAYGVGMFDTQEVLAGRTIMDAAVDTAASAPVHVLVGTVSHCHGAFNVLRISPPQTAIGHPYLLS